jgi:hypothetical protein
MRKAVYFQLAIAANVHMRDPVKGVGFLKPLPDAFSGPLLITTNDLRPGPPPLGEGGSIDRLSRSHASLVSPSAPAQYPPIPLHTRSGTFNAKLENRLDQCDHQPDAQEL